VFAPENRIEHWRSRLPPGRKIAISWRGGDQLYFFGQNRSVPLNEVERLLALPDITWIGVERLIDDVTAERLKSPFSLVDVGRDVAGDLADLAAVLALCESVVTADNTGAHLAGAMGRPGYVLRTTCPCGSGTWKTSAPGIPPCSSSGSASLGIGATSSTVFHTTEFSSGPRRQGAKAAA
jgi:hypothetical protein